MRKMRAQISKTEFRADIGDRLRLVADGVCEILNFAFLEPQRMGF